MQSPVVRVQAEAIRVQTFWHAYQKSGTPNTRLCKPSVSRGTRTAKSDTDANFLARLPKKWYACKAALYAYLEKLNAFREALNA
jgi:hypothetical protein